MEKERRKTRPHFAQAFTLAEALITLTIVGVVAAMVMPAVMANFQEKALDAGRKVNERKIMMAIETMTNLDKMGGYKDTEEFVGQLRKHLNIVKLCSPNNILDCWEDGANFGMGNSIDGDKLFGMNDSDPSFRKADYHSPVVSFIMPDGVSVIMSYNTLCRTDGREPRNCVVVAFDSNGGKKPNEFGKDMFLINSRHFHGFDFSDAIDISSEKGETEVSGMCNGTGPCGNGGHGGGGGGQGGGQDGGDGNYQKSPNDKKLPDKFDPLVPNDQDQKKKL